MIFFLEKEDSDMCACAFRHPIDFELRPRQKKRESFSIMFCSDRYRKHS